MRVIGSGLCRTGTASLKLALEELGYAPCHHMTEVIEAGAVEIDFWYVFSEGKVTQERLQQWGSRWDACVDVPASGGWKELHAAFPEAKVLHSVLPAEQWYASMRHTVWWASEFGRAKR